MPVHFSPSRSLKYWRITLRTVDESSLSPDESARLRCLGCKRDIFFFLVLERFGPGEQAVEEFLHGGELRLGVVEGVHAGPEHGGVAEPLRVPTDVLPRDPHAALVSIESVQLVQVAEQDALD